MKRGLFLALVIVLGVLALYGFVETKWSYSNGERAGWIQKFSRKGWLCKTWEGEMALVTMPGAIPEKFAFTVWDDQIVQQINESMGRRVALSYEQKKGLPSSCFGESEYWITGVRVLSEVTPPGLVPAPVPVPPALSPPGAVPAPAPAAPPMSPPGAAPAPAAPPASPPSQ